ncbi:hypothetical protein TIFTF001_029749 [Ficus carica]|uniref:Secreted protein n=1 Tax=Ficus carica TaxID=3494 RepID=A0AA88J2U0_FICCA|nr:hypothetical protein TIFTF001_029749 [Ficus carica]
MTTVVAVVRFLLALGARPWRPHRHDPPITTVLQSHSLTTVDNDGGFQWCLNHNFHVASATSYPSSSRVFILSWVPTNGRGLRSLPLAWKRYL